MEFPTNAKAFLFDIDGTLCDSDPIHFQIFKELISRKNNEKREKMNARSQSTADDDDENENENDRTQMIVYDEHYFRENIAGKSNEDIFLRIFPELSKAARLELAAQKEREYRSKAENSLRRVHGLTELMRYIDETCSKKCAVTNAPKKNQQMMLKALSMSEWFGDFVVLGEECARAKPYPDPYLKAIRMLGLDEKIDAKECVVFEDSPSGATAAVSAGCYVIGILTSQDEKYLEEVGVHMTIRDFADEKLLQKLKFFNK